MYEERKAFPIKWIIYGFLGLILIIVLIVLLGGNNKTDTAKLYKDKIREIENAALDYAYDNEDDIKNNKEACIGLDFLIEKGYLNSDSKTDNVIYDPRDTKKTLDSDVYLTYEDDEIFAEYKDGKKCSIDYSSTIAIEEKGKTSSSITLKVNIPDAFKLKKIEMTAVDSDEYYEIENEQTFSGLKTGDHIIKVKVTDNNDEVYSLEHKFTIAPIEKPVLTLDETSSTVNISYVASTDSYMYQYGYLLNTEDENNITIVNDNKASYTFKESGYIIAVVSDGINVVKSDKLNVTIIPDVPACVDTTWSTCTGCVASCGKTCEGTQTSNCGTVRKCQAVGVCDTDPTYVVKVKVVNGTTEVTSFESVKGATKGVKVKPNSGYTYSSVKCTTGSATYSTSNNTLTIKNITSARTCTVTFKKVEAPAPKTFVVTYKSDIDGKIITTKTVKENETAPKIDAPSVTGYTFSDWTLNGKAYNFSQKVTSNITIVAKYISQKYKVTFNVNGGSFQLSPQYVASGGTVSEVTPTRAGYHFNYWMLNGNKFNFNTPITSDITLVASWSSLKYETIDMSCANGTCTKEKNLSNFNGIHNVSTTSGTVTYTLNGNLIIITLKGATSARVTIAYY